MAATKTYEWKAGLITWGIEQFNAFVISDLTPDEIEENPFAAIVGSRILADNLDLTQPPAKWAAFAKPNATLQEWRLLGLGSGRKPLPAPSQGIPDSVIRQLEAIA